MTEGADGVGAHAEARGQRGHARILAIRRKNHRGRERNELQVAHAQPPSQNSTSTGTEYNLTVIAKGLKQIRRNNISRITKPDTVSTHNIIEGCGSTKFSKGKPRLAGSTATPSINRLQVLAVVAARFELGLATRILGKCLWLDDF